MYDRRSEKKTCVKADFSLRTNPEQADTAIWEIVFHHKSAASGKTITSGNRRFEWL